MNFSIIPESAPFNAEQRAWLNGFLAGWLGLQPGTQAPEAAVLTSNGSGTSAMAAAAAPSSAAQQDALPWHDPALPLVERLERAEGRPLADQLMAAMAQLDCGACGYVCRTYSRALAEGTETKLSLCSPGGAETSKALKRLLKKGASSGPVTHTNGNGARAIAPQPSGHALAHTKAWSRENPYPATLVRSVRLNKPGSEKETRHVEIHLGSTGPSYQVGDSLGVYPTNCDELVGSVLAALGASGEEPLKGYDESLRETLSRRFSLADVTDECLALLRDSARNKKHAAELNSWLENEGAPAGMDVLDVLMRFSSAWPDPGEFVRTLAPLRPRLYSISSSPRKHNGTVHLTVARASSVVGGRVRKGVASTMLADRVGPGSPVDVFVQKAHGFTLPAEPATPIIMIGPGTGIAPFRAFLHEREAQGASGKNWLFFGDQRSAFDFLYEEELADLYAKGVLTRLDTAFSRDGEAKTYVQHRLRQQARDVFDWLEQGASLYVCGDAKHMAGDVDRTIRGIASEQGGLSEAGASEYVARLASSGRYLRDVY